MSRHAQSGASVTWLLEVLPVATNSAEDVKDFIPLFWERQERRRIVGKQLRGSICILEGLVRYNEWEE